MDPCGATAQRYVISRRRGTVSTAPAVGSLFVKRLQGLKLADGPTRH